MWIKNIKELNPTDTGKELLAAFSYSINKLLRNEYEKGIVSAINKKPKEIMEQNNKIACDAAIEYFEGKNKNVQIYDIGPSVEGYTEEIAKNMASFFIEIKRGRAKYKPPCYVVFGQKDLKVNLVSPETRGYGGKSLELVLRMALELEGESKIEIFGGKTNGYEGNVRQNAAGAIINESTYGKMTTGMNWLEYLTNNDSHILLKQGNALVVTGKTNAPKARVLFAKIG